MKFSRIYSGVSVCCLILAALNLPGVAFAASIDYRAVITVQDGTGASLGYLTEDPNYWTPLIGSDKNAALIMDFTVDGTSGTAINLAPENSGQPFPYFGLVQGRDSTSGDIALGNFNYLYLGGTNFTAPGSTPQLAGNYFSSQTGLAHTSESALWTIDIDALTLVPVWVNSDGSTPATQVFVQSNHVYGGGDADAFHSRFPAPVTSATLHLEILSAAESAPEPASLWTLTLGIAGLGILRHRRRSSCR